MNDVSYTKAMDHKELLQKLKAFAAAHNGKLITVESDYKVSTQYHIRFKDGTQIEIYDYKATNLYSKELPSVAKFRKTKYEWHVKSMNDFALNTFLKEINA